jgi:hypothetical protein
VSKYAGLLAIVLLGFAVTPERALASEGRLVGLNGSDVVFVWRSKADHDEGLSLINAGVHKSNPALLFPLLACIVPSGTKAIITDGGFATHDILVIDGESAGCRGNVAMESFDLQ